MSQTTREELGKFIVRSEEAERYQPPSHRQTTNVRYLAAGQLGCRNFEVIVGKPKPGGGGEPHYHDESEQFVFVLRGTGISEMEGEQFEISAGSLVFHPAGQVHRELAVSEDFEALVVYSPPIGAHHEDSFKSAS